MEEEEEEEEEEGRGGTLSSTNREPECSGGSYWVSDHTRARPGHRAVSIRMDCVLVYLIIQNIIWKADAKLFFKCPV